MSIRGDKRIPIFKKYQPNNPPIVKSVEPEPEPEQSPPPQPKRPPDIMVKEYRGKRKYEQEVRKMIQQGWQIVSVTERPPNGFSLFLFGSILVKQHYTVTYQRE